MKRIHISIQHIYKDLATISNLLKGNSSESIFVDIYSTDPIILKSCKNFIYDQINESKEHTVRLIENTSDLEGLLFDRSADDYDVLIDEPLTNFGVFESMSAEMIRLSRYPFILDWQKKIKGLILNPLILLLVSRGRVIMNILILLLSLYAFREIPQNTLVQYFIGASSPLYYAIWLPYAIVLYLDMRYLSKLYLLISEMSRRSELNDKASRKREIAILSPGLQLDEVKIGSLVHVLRNSGIQALRLTDMKDAYSAADLVFKVPSPDDTALLKYIGVLSGLELKHDMTGEALHDSMKLEPIEASVLKEISESGLLKGYSPSACHKLVVNYEFLANRFELSSDEKSQVAGILLRKFADSRVDGSIGFETESLDQNPGDLFNKISSYM